MQNNFINILSENQIKKFDLEKQLEEYIETKQKDYLYELQENNFQILEWRKLELITAYKNKALMYEDVPEYIKEKHNLPSRDEGIDVIKLENNEITKVYQCKHYHGKVRKSHIKSFFKFKDPHYNLTDVKFYLVGSMDTIINPKIKRQIHYDINEDFGNLNLSENDIKIELRYYQKEAIDKIQKAYDNNLDTINIKIPCGCGKTQLCYHYAMLNYKILILVPRVNIAEQIKDYFDKILKKKINTYWVNCNKNFNSNVTLAVYNSIEDIIDENYDITFIDEAHHVIKSEIYKQSLFECGINEVELKETYIDLISNSIKTKLKVNLSATIDINSEFDYEYDLHQAIEEGYLTDYEINVLYVNQLFKYKDITQEEYIERLKDIVRILKANKEYKHVLIYCSRIETAELCNQVLISNDIISHVITNESTKLHRNNSLRDFKNGLVQVLCCVNCLNEGTDLPIADTAIFLNDRNREINIIQCIGRILRLHKYKNKARIVIFDINSDEGNKKGDYYLRALDKYDKYFKTSLIRRIKFYNHDIKEIDLEESRNSYFDKITKFRLTNENKIKYCQEFYDKFHRLPTKKETIYNWNIGIFISGLKIYNNPIKEKIEKIFHTKIESHPISFEEKCEKCIQFYNEHQRLPTSKEVYKDWNIGTFIEGVKYKDSEYELMKLKEIFKIEIVGKNRISNEYVLKTCREYHEKYNKIPSYKEEFNNIAIGKIIRRIINLHQRPEIRNQIIEIFGDEILIKRGKINITSEEKIQLVIEFYNTHERLPKQTDEKYKNFDIGGYINRLKQGQMENERKEIENKLHIKLESEKNNYVVDNRSFEEKIELCKVFYQKAQRLPNYSENDTELAGFKIYDFINNIRKSNNIDRIKLIEDIFKCEFNEVNERMSPEEKLKILIEFIKQYQTFKNINKNNQNFGTLNIKFEYQELKRCRSETYKWIKSELLKIYPNLVIEDVKETTKLNHDFMLRQIDEYLEKNNTINSKSKIEIDCKEIKLGQFCTEVMRIRKDNSYKDTKPKLLEIFQKHNFAWNTHKSRDTNTQEEIYELFHQYCIKYGRFPRSVNPKQTEEQKYLGNKWKMMNQAKYKETYKNLTDRILQMEKELNSKDD